MREAQSFHVSLVRLWRIPWSQLTPSWLVRLTVLKRKYNCATRDSVYVIDVQVRENVNAEFLFNLEGVSAENMFWNDLVERCPCTRRSDFVPSWL